MERPVRATRAAANPLAIFLRPIIDGMIGATILEEAALRETAGLLPMDERERDALANMVLFRLCAEAQPAGNA